MHSLDPVRYEQLKASGQLPSPKGVALAVVRLLQRDDYEINDLVRLVQSDPAIAGELLKFSNTATYGNTRPIVSLFKAVTTLGVLRVRVLVLALSVLHNHRSGNCCQFDYERFWSRALATAIAAQALASYAKITPEENFTAGLLCSIGELALASIFPERYGEIIDTPDDSPHKRIALELEAFDTDHRELGATLLQEWGLPEVLVTAIYHCELPDEADFSEGSRIFLLTQSLHVALALAEICVADEGARWAMMPNLFAKAARLGIHTDELNSMADGITASWIEWGKLLKIQTREITSFADLLASSPPREQESASPVRAWPGNKSVLLICTKSPESTEITSYFEKNCYVVKYVSNATEGLSVALEEKPDLILVEMSAPEINGLAFCQALRETPLGRCTYIILIGNHNEVDVITQALDMGADDFLQRPITTLSLHTKLRGAFKILQLQKELIKERNGSVDSSGKWAGINRRLINVAMTDPLTHLSNRRHGLDFLSTERAFANANNLPLACLMIDIDHFKQINDQHGHKSGDAALVKISNLLQANTRSVDLVFRFGGEEFCMICPGVTQKTALAIAERIRQNTENLLIDLENLDIKITVSIGVAMNLPTHVDGEALIQCADAALYRAKESGRNRVCLAH